ncbi:Uncharacterised protein [Salmonella enterica subsp. arizonae]|uniref:Uncharacterized protein n=1 Tax=Salmonella enterica subsp. arizonae TaxID=59203 RepID=A0A379RZU6_SALER|nr:Uncharacterised protein [Salmonella enterica subsp. arizonae]
MQAFLKFRFGLNHALQAMGDEAFLFVNDNHQILITVGVSLALYETSKAGPTLEEVKSAISLIDNSDGDALKIFS